MANKDDKYTLPEDVEQKAIDNLKNGDCLMDALKFAGADQGAMNNPSVFARSSAYQQYTIDTVKKLSTARDRALSKLEGKEKLASYSDLISGVEKLTKTERLLSGNSTENITVTREQVDECLKNIIDDDEQTEQKNIADCR